MKYVGLTDEPVTRRGWHGDPGDWKQCGFTTEEEARTWYEKLLAEGYQGNTSRRGWRFGYTYTIATWTKQL